MIWEFHKSKIGLLENEAVYAIELVFIVASSLEIILKLIADGMIFAPNGLIKDFADVLHLFIYIFSLVYVIWQPKIIPRYSAAYW